MLLLPLPTSPAYNVLTEIGGVEYELVYTYDEHRDLWRLGVNRGDVVVMGHRPLLPFVQMRPNAFTSALDGVFALIAPLPTDDAYNALTGGLWNVVYGDPSEIAELADSLADLAGDADDPVVPIEVLYPPNNAILSNPVVTFSGTGPANQLLFARGESIQVDSMGSWVWTHTFNESNPVVVFEGESGQRATVRFSIIMQPLTINPIGEDIDGTRYTFTEDVEVTGTATPNSAITVNGQSVSVDSDGLWSVELTLQAGQSHTITAQAGDGQFAQTSVYVWGKPDLLALQPLVWLDHTDASTLFVDEAGTQPVVLGDPVGRWNNSGVGGGAYYAKMVSSATRPIYTAEGVSGVGNSSGYLEFNFVLKQPFEMLFCSKLNIGQHEAYSGVRERRFDKWIALTAGREAVAGPRVFAKDMASTSASASSNGTFQEDINPVDTTQPHVAGFASQDRQTSNYNNVSWNGVAKEYQADFEIDYPENQRLFQNNQPSGGGRHLTTAHVIMFNRILTEEERACVAAWMLENNNL